jgi:hypothetical protein
MTDDENNAAIAAFKKLSEVLLKRVYELRDRCNGLRTKIDAGDRSAAAEYILTFGRIKEQEHVSGEVLAIVAGLIGVASDQVEPLKKAIRAQRTTSDIGVKKKKKKDYIN